MTSPDNNTLPVYLVATWDDGSFLRLPAYWRDTGRLEVAREDWESQHPQPSLMKKVALLVGLTVHLRTDSIELPVEYKPATPGRTRHLDLVGSEFSCSRSFLNAWTPAPHKLLVRSVPLATPVSINDIELLLVGVTGVISEALSATPAAPASASQTAVSVHKALSALREGFPRELAFTLRDGVEIQLMPPLVRRLKVTLEAVSDRTAPCFRQGAFPEYSAFLALEDCHRTLVKNLKAYGKEHFSDRKQVLAISPELEAIFPLFGEATARNIDAWPGAEAVAAGSAAIGQRTSAASESSKVIERTPPPAPRATSSARRSA